jgi:hypothetical protein
MFVLYSVCVLSGRSLCDGAIPHPEESYRLWCVFECDQVKIKTLYTCCEQVGRRGKDYEKKQKPDRKALGIISNSVMRSLVFHYSSTLN